MAATKKTTKKKKKSTTKPKVLDNLGLGVKRKHALLKKSPHLGDLTVSEFNQLQVAASKAFAGKPKKPGVAGACGVCCCTFS